MHYDRTSKGKNNHGGVLIAINYIISSGKNKNEVDGSLTYGVIIEGAIILICLLYNTPKNSPYRCDVESIQNVLKTIENRVDRNKI